MKNFKKVACGILACLTIAGAMGINIPDVQARRHSTSVRSHNRRTRSGNVVRVSRHRRHYK